MPTRYVKLPNGSYMEWPDGVSAEEFKAKASRAMGTASTTRADARQPENQARQHAQ